MNQSSPNFAGRRVAALESRNAEEISRMIARMGGEPHVSPSLREVPLGENREAIDFAHRLITGGIDVMILLTGVGFRHLLSAVEKHVDMEEHQLFPAAKDVLSNQQAKDMERRYSQAEEQQKAHL